MQRNLLRLAPSFFEANSPKEISSRMTSDTALIDDLMTLLAKEHSDFTILFGRLARFDSSEAASNPALRDLFIDRAAFDAWAQRYAQRLRAEASVDSERAVRMQRVNPSVVLRNHLARVS